MGNIDLKKIKNVHFIGIGGIGISAIARMLLLRGVKVTGSDQSEGEVVEELRKVGATINIGHRASNIPVETELVIYTIAIPDNNQELIEAKNRNIPSVTYPETLTAISEDHYTIAIAGTHGKTTTTGMIAHVLVELGEDPTVVIGSFLKTSSGGRSNFISGRGEYFVVEACEYKKSFLNITPNIAVITNIEEDHLDFYKDLEAIKKAFFEFTKRLKAGGTLVLSLAEDNSREIAEKISKSRPDIKIIDYSKITTNIFQLKIPGFHNRRNAAAVYAVTEALGLDTRKSLNVMESFPGTWRRFEYRGENRVGARIYDDYGHHPTEIAATISGAKEIFPDKKIVLVFQPHQYSRTKLFLNDFANCFTGISELYVLPIYAAREARDPEINNEVLVESIKKTKTVPKVQAVESFDNVVKILEKISGDSICITMGAGDVNKVADSLVSI